MYARNIYRFWWSLLIVMLFTGISPSDTCAEETFEELSGKFAIDIPDGYKLLPQAMSMLYQFDGSGPQIMLLFIDDVNDLQEGMETSIGSLPDDFVSGAHQTTKYKMKINGKKALLNIYQSRVKDEASGKTVEIFALAGAVILKKGSASFIGIYNSLQRKEWEEQCKASFYSLRDLGALMTGAEDITEI
jgi:hypothetical protein